MQYLSGFIRFRDDVGRLWLMLYQRYCMDKLTMWNLCNIFMCILQVILECSLWNNMVFMTKILWKNIPYSVIGLAQTFGLHIQYLHLLAIYLIDFLSNARCTYTTYGSLQIQILYKYISLHTIFFNAWKLTLTYKNVAWKIHGCHKTHGKKCVFVWKKECQFEAHPNDREKWFISTSHFIF